MAISLMELRSNINQFLTNSNTPALLKSSEFQNAIITTENITKPGFEVSTKKMSKDGRVFLSFSEIMYLNESSNHVVEGTYSVPKNVQDYGINNQATTNIMSKENKPGLTESSTHPNQFKIDLSGILTYSELDSVMFIFKDGSQEVHKFINDKFQRFGDRFNVTKGFRYLNNSIFTTGPNSLVLVVESLGEPKNEIYRDLFLLSNIMNSKKEIPSRLNYPNNTPNLFGSLSECTIVVKAIGGEIVYETKLPKITPSNDFVYYFVNIKAHVNGNQCTLINPPSWYKGPTTLNFERQTFNLGF